MNHPQRPLFGAGLAMVALILFVLLDATAKHLSSRYPVPLLIWARYTVHLALMLVLLAPRLGHRLYRTRRPALHLLRAGLLLGTSLCGLAAFNRLPLAEATAVIFASPVIVVLLARPLLGEQIGPWRSTAVVMGFAGVLLVARPGGGLGPEGIAFALAAAVFYAIYQILTRKMSRTESPVTLLFHTALTGSLAMSAALPGFDHGPAPDTREYLLFLAMGTLAATAHFLLTKAFREAPASLLSPMLYVQIVWATLFGWLVFGQVPDTVALAGMAVIGVAGILIAVDGRRSSRPGPVG
ncbi:DMT family transporter [Zoogloea dura]|uniref:DMT family transporter n=1 Tax=Zoogloea dura TaxID=2728840 RepID=A0A848G8Q1_9RHOO|nr:DMT family transporter [Zoogloea dura]NML27654.1 DMT family transporter [Zoogloea dura]